MYKHYIRLNENKDIIKIFSSAFEVPEENDVIVYEGQDRHFNQIDGKSIINEDNLFIFKYIDNAIIEKTHDEIYTVEYNNTKEREQILNELLALDSKITREEENIYNMMITTGMIADNDMYITTKENIVAKIDLRNKLSVL